MSDADKAVFLSYAREDGDTARRMAEALRAFGIEVWFDQHELRGGDQWDARIRGQIKACALFIPIVSPRTEERTEGYFRREWKLAVDRTHDMAGGRAFIVPVVIGDTPETGAAVPDEFLRYQWTRLPDGAPTPEFVSQVKRLLESGKKPALRAELPKPPTLPAHLKEAARMRTVSESPGIPAPARAPASRSRWILGGVVVALAAVGAAVYFGRRPAPVSAPSPAAPAPVATAIPPPALVATVNPKSIAVLPFDNLSADAANVYFADGMHDEVITALAKVRDLTVISRTSVLAYRKSEERNLRKIAAELGVAHVLEGSVQRSGDRVKVIVQLVEASSDRHLWAETYVENVTDVFTIQSKLAGAITAELKATLSPEERSRIAARPTTNPGAYDAYLEARALVIALVPGASRGAYDIVVERLERAVALDPTFTRAQAELCYVNGIMYWFGNLDATPARRARARAALDAAIAHGPDLPETRMARGTYLYTCENDWGGALTELTAAEPGLPNDALLAYLRGLCLRRLGRVQESLAPAMRAIDLSPQDVNYRIQHQLSLLALHRFEDWRATNARNLARFPNERNFLRVDSIARLQLDGDWTAFLARQQSIPPADDDPDGLLKAALDAWTRGDLSAADRALADPRVKTVPGVSGIVSVPVPLRRGVIAHLQGRAEDARRLGIDAAAILKGMSATRRQEPWHLLNQAMAEALAGRADHAARLVRAGVALSSTRDSFSHGRLLWDAAEVLLVADREDEALELARAAVVLPSEIVPELARRDPTWARLKDDPRFAEVLRAIQPL
jgi:TolB-like protein